MKFFILLILIILIIKYIIKNDEAPKYCTKGDIGEIDVRVELELLDQEKYYSFHDIMIEIDNRTTQIDHIVVSIYGIFVIETKNYNGFIRGNQYNSTWTQYLSKNNKFQFNNPLRQNYGHIKALSQKLNIQEDKFISIIAFGNDAKLDIEAKEKVVNIRELYDTIMDFTTIKFNDISSIESVKNKILSENITSEEKRHDHIVNIQTELQEKEDKINNMICPSCGWKLLERKGKCR
ncbi:MAG: nuclease-related domain-containing protein [Peptoanaerobacter stomatis]|uniref:nuclease-related domain-containing protein n=1 Tax=Peptoanaerobacter stomatis TaxID=796937 RepID=UPI003F9F2E8B